MIRTRAGAGLRGCCRVVPRARASYGQRAEKVRGWRSFTAIPTAHEPVVARIGGHELELVSDRGGVVDARVPVELEPGWHAITLEAEGSGSVDAEVFVVDPAERFGLVSDVDDTVMVTALPRPLVAA